MEETVFLFPSYRDGTNISQIHPIFLINESMNQLNEASSGFPPRLTLFNSEMSVYIFIVCTKPYRYI